MTIGHAGEEERSARCRVVIILVFGQTPEAATLLPLVDYVVLPVGPTGAIAGRKRAAPVSSSVIVIRPLGRVLLALP